MRGENFIRQATAYISDPEKAMEVRRELKAHLDEAMAEVVAQGVDPETAELVAVARMGSPESLAIELAAAHHRHLPWRLYLAPVPMACLLVVLINWHSGADYWRVGRWWIALLLFCLAPARETAARLGRLMLIDMRAKWHWLQQQPLRAAVAPGGVSGVVAGLVWGALPFYEPHLRFLGLLLIVVPVVPALIVARVLRPPQALPPVVIASISALAFPLGLLPGLLLWWDLPTDWLFMTGFFCVMFALAALAAGWLVQTIQRKLWTSRT